MSFRDPILGAVWANVGVSTGVVTQSWRGGCVTSMPRRHDGGVGRCRYLVRVGIAMAASAILLPVVGCMPVAPSLTDGRSKLMQFTPTPLPVPPGPDGGWHLVEPTLGLIGEANRLARVDLDGNITWSVQLPIDYALTGRPGAPHTAISVPEAGALILIAGAQGTSGPVALRALN